MLHLTYSLIALGLAGHAAADGWDDFTNNLATDLAPIISLFGEQATKQYLSESITWLDYFIFSMAPIGILTALVSAIRVCGSSSLRAFIGRAKEGTGDVEAELLSSTSRDVCELYNKGGITRIFGRPKILEFVHDPNAPDSEFTDPVGMAGISTFRKYAETDHGKDEWEPFPECRDKFPPEEYAPNLSHNVGIKRLDYMWFVMAAILGFVLQAGVLIFAGIATYLLRLEKEGAQPPSYACPMSIIGTAMVCGGMFLCAFLVGESTEERIYARRRDSESSRRSTIYWLQPPQVLGDQTFESFCYVVEGHGGSLSEYVSSWKKDNTTASWYVWLAVSITVVGFVLQFVGFRGTHSAISMAQLGATLIMTVARAALRTQRLDTKENMFTHLGDLKYHIKGHELDWLAIRMGSTQLKNRPQASRKTDSTKIADFERLSWSFHGMAELGEKNEKIKKGLCNRTLSRNFANDMVSVRDMAEKLALAIESVADVFFSTATMKKSWLRADVLSWAVKCGLSFSNGERNIEELSIHFHRELNDFGDDGIHWRLENRHNLEGILGLWLWSLISNHEPVTADYRRPGALDRGTTPKRRIISFDDDLEVLGFNMWNRGSRPYTLKETVKAANDQCNPSTIWHQNDQGTFIPLETDKAPLPGFDGTRYCQLFGWYTGGGHASTSGSTESLTPRQTWAIPATSNTLSLCAQEMLGVFVKSILNATVGIGQVELDSTNPFLKSILVSKAVDAIVASGVASTDDAIWCILPQVVVKERLAGRTLLWHAASIGYEKLVDFLLRDKGSDVEQNNTEFNFDVELGDSERGRTPLWQAAANGHDSVVRILLNHGANAEATDKDEITALVKAAENGCQAVVRMLIERGGAGLSLKSASSRTALHLAAANGHAGVVHLLLEEGADDKVTDESNATPLSLAIDSGHATTIKLLNAHRADHHRTQMSHQSTENDEM
ncbi:ankyrin repeat domain-containing protein 28 [Colletotrichum kahawae]|uniref:Ankyrin repeat domain-containing protein 28 n=1 Tax=Colletotrichum kahawae TaxID=34407 RepID=A0AAE0DB09_COLKA|nr:ankyrin repeat domain-containing protein 28 [Colletotrichum kahawae]